MSLRVKLSQVISLLVLAPLFFPVFSYCPFRLPYLYCFVCPRRCLWYRIRGVVLLIVLGLNIKNDLFCLHLCPFGTIQTLLSKISPGKVSLPKYLSKVKYIWLALIVVILVVTKLPHLLTYRIMGLSLSQIFILRMKHLAWAFFLLWLTMSIFSFRFFCYNFCPIKTLGAVLPKTRKSPSAMTF